MSDDQNTHNGGGWQPHPQGEYDSDATAFVQLPEGLLDAPLAAPGHGYVPPQITVNPTTADATDPAATGAWVMPPEVTGAGGGRAVRWPEAGTAQQQPAPPAQGHDGTHGYDPRATGQWTFDAQSPESAESGERRPYGQGGAPAYERDYEQQDFEQRDYEQQDYESRDYGHQYGQQPHGPGAPASGTDVTGQWSIPVADGDLPDESGEFTASSLAAELGAWGRGGAAPPATLPGGAPAPWATGAGAGAPWGAPSREAAQDALGTPRESLYEAPHEPLHAPARQAPQPVPHEPVPHEPVPHEPAAHEAVPERPEEPEQESRFEKTQLLRAISVPSAERPVEQPVRRPVERPGAEPAAEPVAEEPVRAPEVPQAPEAPEVAESPEASAPPVETATEATAEMQAAVPAGFGSEAHEPPAPAPDVPAAETAPVDAPDETPVPDDAPAPEPAAEPDAAVDAEPQQAAAPDESAAPAEDPGATAAQAVETAETIASVEAVEAVEGSPAVESVEAVEAATDAALAPTPLHDDHPLVSYVLRVNGTDRPVTDAWIGESLLYVLRERLGLAGAKDGCSQGECGACNVQVDGRLVASCLVPAATTAGSEVRTVEGLAADGQPSDVQRALAACGAVQCGFCVPGMAMTVHDLLEGNPAPTDLEARRALCGNLCRCSGYRGVLDAVREVVAEREASATAAGAAAHDGHEHQHEHADEARIPHQAGPGAGGVHQATHDGTYDGVPGGPYDGPHPYDGAGPEGPQGPYGQDGGHA